MPGERLSMRKIREIYVCGWSIVWRASDWGLVSHWGLGGLIRGVGDLRRGVGILVRDVDLL